MEHLPYLERVKIQSEILLPLYRRLREEIGAERAAELLRDAVQEYASAMGSKIRDSREGSSLDKFRSLIPAFTAGEALDVESLEDNAERMSFNVTGCRYADYFKSIGEAEFGALVTCGIDPPLARAIGEDLDLERSSTIMSGGRFCDFRFSRKT